MPSGGIARASPSFCQRPATRVVVPCPGLETINQVVDLLLGCLLRIPVGDDHQDPLSLFSQNDRQGSKQQPTKDPSLALVGDKAPQNCEHLVIGCLPSHCKKGDSLRVDFAGDVKTRITQELQGASHPPQQPPLMSGALQKNHS